MVTHINKQKLIAWASSLQYSRFLNKGMYEGICWELVMINERTNPHDFQWEYVFHFHILGYSPFHAEKTWRSSISKDANDIKGIAQVIIELNWGKLKR